MHTTDAPSYSNGQHTWGVTTLLYRLAPDRITSDSEFMKAIHFHDSLEFRTGDWPATFKWENPTLKDILEHMEVVFSVEMDFPCVELSKGEFFDWFKACDLLELMLHCYQYPGYQDTREIYNRCWGILTTRQSIPTEVRDFVMGQYPEELK